ncbi:MAG: OmpA family protein, partial [Ignavibacteria bacterium]|nr:OmpA family protein [Ignavibacteria bacterium]
PYFSAGVGVTLYQRLDWQANGLPDKKLKTTFAIPVNLGVEYFMNNQLSVTAEIGYRILDDKPETVENGGFDSYATIKGGVFYYFGSSDEDDDDGDGLTNGEERTHGTDRFQPDTDGDGLKDGDEVHLFRSNPREPDTDSDGLDDRAEVYTWKTDPRVSDTDKDGISDFEETGLGTNPVSADTDGDVLLDGEEIAAGSDPLQIDTDFDGLSDYLELRTYHTHVTIADSDQDSLSDGREVTVFGTNPMKADTDSGGVIDGHEVGRETDPLDPADDLLSEQLGVPVGQSIVIEGVVFAPGSSVIGRGSATALENAFITVALLGQTRIDIIGHTDNVGTVAENDRLSLERAEAVLQWFVKQGIDESRLRAIGKGGREPIAPNNTESGRVLNRRIEMLIRN